MVTQCLWCKTPLDIKRDAIALVCVIRDPFTDKVYGDLVCSDCGKDPGSLHIDLDAPKDAGGTA